MYNYLFYHGYSLALKSKSNRDTPLFLPVAMILVCLIFNLGALSLFFEGLGISSFQFKEEHKFIWVILFSILIFFYYLYGKRYKRILMDYQAQNQHSPTVGYSILIVFLYYVISFLLLLLAGLYRNKDWIFA